MTTTDPPRDSAFQAVADGFGVIRKPAYLWAPVLLEVIASLPLLAIPGAAAPPPTFTDETDLEPYLRSLAAWFALTFVISLVVGPLLSAVGYRLAAQYVDGQPARPFGPGILGLAWRYFLQTIAFVLLALGAILALLLVWAVLQAILGFALATAIVGAVAIIGYFAVLLRLAVAPVLLLNGDGPIEAIRHSWRLTSDRYLQLIRWLVVTALVVGIVTGLVNAIMVAIGDGVRQPLVGQIAGIIAITPLTMVSLIVYVRLTRLISGPPPAPATAPSVPAWMQPPPTDEALGAVQPGAPADVPEAPVDTPEAPVEHDQPEKSGVTDTTG